MLVGSQVKFKVSEIVSRLIPRILPVWSSTLSLQYVDFINPLKPPRAPSTIEPYILRRKMRLTCLADSLSLTKKAPAKPKWKKAIYTKQAIYTHILFHIRIRRAARKRKEKIAKRAIYFFYYFLSVLFSFAAFSMLECVSKRRKMRKKEAKHIQQ